jgi:hypothetical protein
VARLSLGKYSEFPSVGGQRVTRRRRLTTVGR